MKLAILSILYTLFIFLMFVLVFKMQLHFMEAGFASESDFETFREEPLL